MAKGITRGVARRLMRTTCDHVTLRTRSIRRAQQRLDILAAKGCRFLICIPYLKSGGAERVAANLAHALSELYGPDSVAILVTDWSGLAVRLIFPENVFTSYPPKVPITKIVAASRAGYEERVWDLMSALLSLKPELIINVNSRLMWECYERFAPVLASKVRLGTVAFCHAEDKRGRAIGYQATHLERMLPHLDFVISDNQTFVDELTRTMIGAPASELVPTQVEWAAAKILSDKMDPTKRASADIARYLAEANLTKAEWTAANQLATKLASKLAPEEAGKIRCIYQYASVMRPRKRVVRGARPQILWASRVTRSKYPELLPRIARLLPDCDIHAYGAREFGYRFPAAKRLLLPEYDIGDRVPKAPNLFWHGAYKSFGALPLETFDAMLYTSLFDGMPNVLLDAGGYHIPVIAPLIGGIGELITQGTGWPVANAYDPREYAERVRELVAAPDEAVLRASRLANLIGARHSFKSFCDEVRDLVERKPHRRAAEPQRPRMELCQP